MELVEEIDSKEAESEVESGSSVKTGLTRIVELIATTTLILIILKALKLIDLSWAWVLCPLWVLAFIFLIVMLVIIVASIKEEKRAKKEK